MDLPEITEVKRVVLRPGDRLAVHLDRELDEHEMHTLVERLRAVFGDDSLGIVLFGPGAGGLEVLSSDGEPSAEVGRQLAAHLAEYRRQGGEL